MCGDDGIVQTSTTWQSCHEQVPVTLHFTPYFYFYNHLQPAYLHTHCNALLSWSFIRIITYLHTLVYELMDFIGGKGGSNVHVFRCKIINFLDALASLDFKL